MKKLNIIRAITVVTLMSFFFSTAVLSTLAANLESMDELFIPKVSDTQYQLPQWAKEDFGNQTNAKIYEDSTMRSTRKTFFLFFFRLAEDNVKMQEDVSALEKFADYDDVMGMSVKEQQILTTLVSYGILKGDLKGEELFLNLNLPIKRCEASAIINRMSSKFFLKQPRNSIEAKEFTDVSKTHWAYDDVQWAYKQGIFEGIGNSFFSPDTNITVVEVLKCGYSVSTLDKNIGVKKFAIAACKTFKTTMDFILLSKNVSSIEVEAGKTISFNIFFTAEKLTVDGFDKSVIDVKLFKEGKGFVINITAKKAGDCKITLSCGSKIFEEIIPVIVKKSVTSSGGSSGGSNTEILPPTPPGKDDVNPVPPLDGEETKPDEPNQPKPPSGGGDIGNPPVVPDPPEQPNQPTPPGGNGGNIPTPPPGETISPPTQSSNEGIEDPSIG